MSDSPSTPTRLGRALAGVVLGVVVGAIIMLATVAFRTVAHQIFLHSVGELVGWVGLPVVLVPVAAVWASFRLSGRAFWLAVAVVLGGVVAGILAGASIGAAFTPPPSHIWAGGIMGAGAGALLALLFTPVVVTHDTGSEDSGDSAAPASRDRTAAAALILLMVTGGCEPPPPAPGEARTIPVPDPSEVESVVFLLGDPGMARMDTYPVLPRMKQDVERWSSALGSDGQVAMVVLGDIIYPDGLHPADHERRRTDSLRLTDQIEVISGEGAERAGAQGIFVPGNHDWGQEEDWNGAVRLVRLQDLLEDWDGAAADRLILSPEPGTGGPDVIDLQGLRLILLDTAWWLLGSDPAEKDAVIAGVRQALGTAGDRRIVMAAHHPLESGGPHGTGVGLGNNTLGIRDLLKKAGLLIQDLESRPYDDLKRRLLNAFADVGPPDLFVGGHEHSLQIFASPETDGGRSMVVGSASKLTEVRQAPGMLFGRAEPGYGKIFVLEDGTLHLRLEAAPARFLTCNEATGDRGEAEIASDRGVSRDGPEPTAGGSAACMEKGVASFRAVWGEDLDGSS